MKVTTTDQVIWQTSMLRWMTTWGPGSPSRWWVSIRSHLSSIRSRRVLSNPSTGEQTARSTGAECSTVLSRTSRRFRSATSAEQAVNRD